MKAYIICFLLLIIFSCNNIKNMTDYTISTLDDTKKVDIYQKLLWNGKNNLEIELSNYNYNISNITVKIKTSVLDTSNDIILKSEVTNYENRFVISITNDKNAEITTNYKFLHITLLFDDPHTKLEKVIYLYEFELDMTPPQIEIISHSPELYNSSAGLVFYRVIEDNSYTTFLKSSDNKIFYPINFKTNNCYLSYFATPLNFKNYSISIIAKDRAGNETNVEIPVKFKERRFKISKINLNPEFNQQKVSELNIEHEIQTTDQFKIYSQIVSAMKSNTAINVVKATTPVNNFYSFALKPFLPMTNYRITSQYGELRLFYLNNKKVRESYHLGLDLASVSNAALFTPMDGVVIYTGYNGAYGNTIIIDHGAGLYTLYSHCSKFLVSSGKYVKKNDVIAYSGKSGYATGDHLHFSVLVQGNYVNPADFMDKLWYSNNIIEVFNKANEEIK